MKMILQSELVTVILALMFVRKLHAQYPNVPCPNIFKYDRANDETIGLITINNINFGETLLEIKLSQSGNKDLEYLGHITLNYEWTKIIDNIKSGTPLTYTVYFALKNVIPQVRSIRVNGDRICFGPKVDGPGVIISLKHKIKTGDVTNKNNNKILEATLPFANTTSSPVNVGQISRSNVSSPISRRVKDSFSNHFLFFNNECNCIFDTTSTGRNGQKIPPTTSSTTSTTKRPRSRTSLRIRPSESPSSQSESSQPTTTTPRPRSRPSLRIRPSESRSSQSKSSPTTPPITTTPRSRPALEIRPSESRPSQSESSSQFIPKSAKWTEMDLICGQENFNSTDPAMNEKQPTARFPWIVALFKKNRAALSFQCGGSLITTRTVISAAHCFYTGFNRIKEEDILVSMGRQNLTDWSETYITHRDVERIIEHPDFKPKQYAEVDADIVIIQLKESVTFSSAIRPICLWRGPLDVNEIEGFTGNIAGWERDEEENIITSPKLITSYIVSQSTCIRFNYQLLDLTSNRTLCAGNSDGSALCYGDSGSGLMIQNNTKWMLRGIVSLALNTMSYGCSIEEYAVYTDVAQFLGWIYDNSVF